jgi:hypothetical protein
MISSRPGEWSFVPFEQLARPPKISPDSEVCSVFPTIGAAGENLWVDVVFQ